MKLKDIRELIDERLNHGVVQVVYNDIISYINTKLWKKILERVDMLDEVANDNNYET